MKKKFLIIFVFAICLFGGCTLSAKTILEKTSDYCHCYFYANNDFAEMEFSCGQREELFEYDGKSTSKKNYGVIKVNFKKICQTNCCLLNLLSMNSQCR